jgi:hypothetical protein
MIKSRFTASITDARVRWWELAPNCIAAYQPKGAHDYQASKVNLANPGTYNAYEGTAPSWNTVDGWIFVAAATTHLKTDVLTNDNQTSSMIIRFSNGLGYLMGARNVGFNHRTSGYTRQYIYGTIAVGSGTVTNSGISCLAGTQGYYNGSTDGNAIASSSVAGNRILMIGSRTTSLYVSEYNCNAYIQAVAIYNYTLTADQVAALTAAMNAL